MRTGHQTLLLQLHRIHYYASFTRYSSARYNCSIVSRTAKLPRVKRTYTPYQRQKRWERKPRAFKTSRPRHCAPDFSHKTSLRSKRNPMTQPILGWNREKSGNRNRKRVDREFTKEFAASVCVRCPSRRNERFVWLRTVRRNFREDEQEEKKKEKKNTRIFGTMIK